MPTLIGPYRVEREIARGGMGIVYLAHDTRLDRTVALKALPSEVASDPERLQRFEREAKLLASVNHPNIAAIYDVVESGGRRYLALEHIEGETLAKLLSGGALSVEDAVVLCIQIAVGMEAAHERGIIHRDLKPGNVMITRDERVKIVDFGLAKGALVPDSAQTNSPTLSASSPTISSPAFPPGTVPGVILGTAPYLSPEQARGKFVDRRTDIWSWGCILYECLTGKMAFHGETVTDTVAAILKADPDWGAVPKTVPARVLDLMHRCLEKDPRTRLRDIGDARLLLEEARSTGRTSEPALSRAHVPSRWALIGGLAGLTLVVAGATLLGFELGGSHSRSPHSKGLMNLAITIPPDLRYVIGRISSDGGSIIMLAKPQADTSAGDSRPNIFVRRLDERAFRPLPGTERATGFVLSPDGKSICFVAPGSNYSSTYRFFRSGLDGSAVPSPICDIPSDIVGVTWPEQDTLFATTVSGKEYLRISMTDGTSSRRIPLMIPGFDGSIQMAIGSNIPGDRGVFLVTTAYEEGAYRHGVAVLDLRSGKAKRLVRDGISPRYVPGYLLFTRGSTLFAAPFSLSRLELLGAPFAAFGGIRMVNNIAAVSAADDGTIIYVLGGGMEERHLVTLDRTGVVREWSPDRRPFRDLSISPDGERLALVHSNEDLIDEIWTSGRSQALLRKAIASPGADCSNPVWSPDGTRIAFRRHSGSKDDGVYVSALGGEGSAQCVSRTPKPDQELYPNSWSPDGTQLLCSRFPPGRQELVVLPLVKAQAAQPQLLSGGDSEFNGQFSPNGQWIAYESIEAGRAEAFVREYRPNGTLGDRIQLSVGGAASVFWGRDGRQVFHITNDGKVMASALRPVGRPEVSSPVRLWDLDSIGALHLGNLLTDGRLITIQKGKTEDVPSQIEITLNLVEDLRAKGARSGH